MKSPLYTLGLYNFLRFAADVVVVVVDLFFYIHLTFT